MFKSLVLTGLTGLTGAALLGAAVSPADAAPPAPPRPAVHWQQVGEGITSGVSGMAVVRLRHGAVDALLVRDNKEPGQNRLALLHRTGTGDDARVSVRPLSWPGTEPVDLESVSAVPGHRGQYVALSSDGHAYWFSLAGNTVSLRGTFALPAHPTKANYEGFALTRGHDGELVAVWADRGQDERPGTLNAATLDLGSGSFGRPVSREVRAPYPTKDVRHVSDLAVSSDGSLTVSAASDPGDDGPFTSALYRAGHLTTGRHGAVHLSVTSAPQVLAAFTGHKIEALACAPGSRQGLLGTDDENAGGAVAAYGFCRS
ncbi:hypothetical protein ACFV3R_29965 [Streptomyces sp. NPDC059740]|uniref:hypothetical protein n=1 Tax=Streptomyces sp. NPDC059740 TaxID=3346926 RepID=UPI003649166E